MRLLIAYCKVAAAIAVTLGVYAVFMMGYGLLRLFNRPIDEWRNSCLMTWGKWTAFTLSVETHVEGHPPEPPFFLVSNHLSYVDIIVLLSQLKTTFVAKAEVADWPVLGFIAKTIGIVFVDRNRRSDVHRVNEEIATAVTENRGLTLFPEGTTSPGSKVLRFRAGLLDFPARSELGAHYCALSYSIKNGDDRAYEIVSWWGVSPLNTHIIRLAKEQKIHATIAFGNNVIVEKDRKVLSTKLHSEVSGVFKPMCRESDIEFEPLQF